MFTPTTPLTPEETQKFLQLIVFNGIADYEKEAAYDQLMSAISYAIKINPEEIIKCIRFFIETKLTLPTRK